MFIELEIVKSPRGLEKTRPELFVMADTVTFVAFHRVPFVIIARGRRDGGGVVAGDVRSAIFDERVEDALIAKLGKYPEARLLWFWMADAEANPPRLGGRA